MNLTALTSRLSIPGLGASANGPDALALTEVRGHLTFTAKKVTAWYTLPEKVWPFQSDTSREALLATMAGQYAGLAGRHLSVRRTTIPFPANDWVRGLANTSNPLPDVITVRPRSGVPLPSAHRVPTIPDGPTWVEHLRSAHSAVVAGNYTLGRTHLGVSYFLPSALFGRRGRTATGLPQALVKQISNDAELLGAGGMAARPAYQDELFWLLHRSAGIGLNPPTHRPADIGPEQIVEFIENLDVHRGPYDSTTRLTDRRTGETSYVAVATLGRMEELTIPQRHLPWAHMAEQAPFPVEWSSRVDILGPAATRGSVERRLLTITHQRRDYAEHGIPAPPALARMVRRAAEIGDEIDTGLPVDASRAHGWHRMAVSGGTQEECLERLRELVRMYDEARITVQHPKGQWAALREFMPGEPVADTGHLRRMPVRLFAAAVPQATASVGDDRGDFIGHTAGAARKPVFFDPFFPMETRERSGLGVFVAEPGAGKSTLLGALGYLAARRGAQVTLVDPSGPLARLCELPELWPYARVVNLVGSESGTLAPYAMIPTPVRSLFPRGEGGDELFRSALANVQAERVELVLNVLQMLLPPQFVADGKVTVALHKAIQMVPPREDSTLDDVLDALDTLGNDGDVDAKNAAVMLATRARLPLARLFFGTPPADALDTDSALTVITMNGLRLPDLSVDRAQWSLEEQLAVPMLHLAHRLAVRRCYSGDMNRRKFVGLDEAHVMDGWSSGRAFLIRLARDSRKWNIAALVASQNPRDILNLEMQNLISTVFVGRIVDDEQVAAEALRLLRVPTDAGYEGILATLSQHTDTSSTSRLGYREFVMRDVDGRVQKIRIDVSHIKGLLAALDTTPGGTR
jgi:hypothetical protein